MCVCVCVIDPSSTPSSSFFSLPVSVFSHSVQLLPSVLAAGNSEVAEIILEEHKPKIAGKALLGSAIAGEQYELALLLLNKGTHERERIGRPR